MEVQPTRSMPTKSGTDGVTNNSTTFTAASGNFSSADIGAGIAINDSAGLKYYRITEINSSTSVTLDRTTLAGGSSGKTWAVGGAWATLGNSFWSGVGTVAAVRTGDAVYVGAGVYRQVMAIGLPSVFNGILSIVGDVTGQYTGDAGMVQLTAYTTNDKTAPSATTLLNLNGKSNLAFSNIMFVGGNSNLLTATTLTSQNITFRDCALISYQSGISTLASLACAAGIQMNWVFDRCLFFGSPNLTTGVFLISMAVSSVADYNANVLFQNSIFYGTAAEVTILVTSSGSGSFKGGGIVARGCTSLTGAQFMVTQAGVSTIYPCAAYNSILSCNQVVGSILNANTSGQIVENYNVLYGPTPRTNVAIGPNSVSNGSYAPLFHFGQERIWGALQRAFGEPMANSPLLGFGSDGAHTLYDLMNRPRPAGGGSALPAVGALERGNTAVQATSPAPPQGTNVWQFTGPGVQDFQMPVSALATGLSMSVYRDSNYAAPPNSASPIAPCFQILANPAIGVAAQTIVDSGPPNQWNTLNAASFTPTGTGVVTVRMWSDDASGISVVSFADITPS